MRGKEVMNRVAHASTVGSGHERLGEDCADAAAVHRGADGVLRFAVCDGAGSAASGGRGARIAADHALALLRSHVAARAALDRPLERVPPTAPACAAADAWRRTATRVVFDVRHVLRGLARDEGVPVGELATTLLLGVVDGAGARLAQVGDGAIVVDTQGACSVPTRAPESEHPNETVFVTSSFHDVRAELSTAVVPGPIDGLLAFTDGIEHLMLRIPGRAPLPGLARTLLRDVARARSAEHASARLLGLLRSSKVRARSDDDCTLVVAVRDAWLSSWAPAPRSTAAPADPPTEAGGASAPDGGPG